MAYTPKQIESAKETIIERMLNGKSLKSILDSDNKLPSRPVIYTWLNEESSKFDQEFRNNYAQATQDRADYLVEEIISIADDQEDDVYTDDDGNEHTNHNVINRARLRVDARKWIAGKMKPKKYGDKIGIELDDKRDKTIEVKIIE